MDAVYASSPNKLKRTYHASPLSATKLPPFPFFPVSIFIFRLHVRLLFVFSSSSSSSSLIGSNSQFKITQLQLPSIQQQIDNFKSCIIHRSSNTPPLSIVGRSNTSIRSKNGCHVIQQSKSCSQYSKTKNTLFNWFP